MFQEKAIGIGFRRSDGLLCAVTVETGQSANDQIKKFLRGNTGPDPA